MRTGFFCLLLLVVSVYLSFPVSPASAEGVLLTNGSRIEGKVTDNRSTTGTVIVEIEPVGKIILRAGSVEKILGEEKEPAAGTGPKTDAASGDFVRVEFPPNLDRNGPGIYYGILSAKSTADTIVLEVPGAGYIRLSRAARATITKSDVRVLGLNTPEAPAAGESIKTTHVVRLRNGRKLRGDLVDTPQSEPLRLRIGSVGQIDIPRREILPDGVQAEEGSIEIPPAAPAGKAPAGAGPQGKAGEIPEDAREQIKEELRREILKELLDQLIEEKIGSAVEIEKAVGEVIPVQERTIPDATTQRIREDIRELTRQRSRNRVRAERHLRDMGAVVLPFLDAVADHPFQLTRRAVQRIVRDIGDLRGAPIAIAGLDDPDKFVREIAHEALQKILPSTIRYRADANVASRRKAQTAYYDLWDEAVRTGIRDAILARVDANR